VRTTPLIGRKAWFGPRRFGWGLGPVSPEGWAVTGAAAAAVVVTVALSRSYAWIIVAIVVALVVVAFLKGTSPGGPTAFEDYQNTKDSGG
jgi:hypothetical protein